MAKDKKSFILYVDQKELFNKLPDEIAGKLIKHIYAYVNDENPISEDLIIDIAFEPIKQQLKRDLKLFEDKRVKRREAGKEGANKRWQPMANDSNRINAMAKIADNVNDNVNVNDNNIYRRFAHLSISNDEVSKLLEKYTIEQIDSTLDDIQNFKGHKKYTSLYLTATKWLSKNHPKVEMIYDPLVEKARKYGYIE